MMKFVNADQRKKLKADATLLDVARLAGADEEVGVIEANMNAAPELISIPFKLIDGITYKTAIRAAVPQGAFRSANAGSATKKSTWAEKLIQCYFYDQTLKVDQAIALANGGNSIDLMAEEEAGGYVGMAQYLGSQVYYGRSNGGDANGFHGFLDVLDSSMVVDATGTGGSTCSVWLVHTGRHGARFVGGNNSIPGFGEWIESMLVDGFSNPYRGWFNNIGGYIGLQIGQPKCVCRIKNLTSAKPCTPALIAQAISKFPIGLAPNVIFMNRNAWSWLQNSLTATTPTGAPAPFPQEQFGVRIVVTDSLTQSEAAS